MIIGNLQNIKNEIGLYPAGLQAGLKFLLETDLCLLPLGEHEIQGKQIYAKITEYKTEPKEQRRPESHKKYVDIQYICSGEEMIGSAQIAEVGEIDEDCLSERDILFYKSIATETQVILTQGMFAVYFPWDVHRPNCNAGEQTSNIRKILVKIEMDLLNF
jgi:biofilm protein TabA